MRKRSLTASVAIGEPGPPWRVEISETDAPPVTLILDGDKRLTGVEFAPDSDPSEVLVHVGANWRRYVSFARSEALPWGIQESLARSSRIREVVRQTSPQGRSLGTAFYRDVAEQYRIYCAREDVRGPTTRIALEHGVSRSTASRWVRTARKMGLLRDAPGERKAGEVSDDG